MTSIEQQYLNKYNWAAVRMACLYALLENKNEKKSFNTNKKSNKNYALLNGLIVDIENSKFIKGTVLIKDCQLKILVVI